MHVVNSCSGLTRSRRPETSRRPVSVNVDSSLSHLAKALFSSKHLSGFLFRQHNKSCSSSVMADGWKRGADWDLSDSFIVNQIKTGHSRKHMFLDDSGLLDKADYELMSVSSPFQAKSRYAP